MKSIKSQYDKICDQTITPLLPKLFSKSVVTEHQMRWIENKEKLELKGMKALIDEVILPSLQLKIRNIYKGFLQSMEEIGDLKWEELAKRLGKYMQTLTQDNCCVVCIASLGKVCIKPTRPENCFSSGNIN